MEFTPNPSSIFPKQKTNLYLLRKGLSKNK